MLSSEVIYNVMLLFKVFTTKSTAKMFHIQMSEMMTPQFTCCTETLWTFIANIRLYTFMTTYVFLKATSATEFLAANVTRQPSTFIV